MKDGLRLPRHFTHYSQDSYRLSSTLNICKTSSRSELSIERSTCTQLTHLIVKLLETVHPKL